MWEESQAENTKLRLELSGVRGDLETARHQLESAEKKVKYKYLKSSCLSLVHIDLTQDIS